MRRSAIIGAWVVATALAVGVGIGAVQLAGAQVADNPIQPLAADEVPTLPSPADPTQGSDGAPSTVPSTAGPSTTTPPQPTTSTAAPTTIPASLPTTAPKTPASSTTSTAPPTTTTSPAQPEVSGYQLIGGSVSIAASPGVVNLVSATPNNGFIAEVESSGPNEVKVEFKSSSHESKFAAKWSDGRLDVSTEEEGDD